MFGQPMGAARRPGYLGIAVGFGLWSALVCGGIVLGWAQNPTTTTVSCVPAAVVVGEISVCTVTVIDTAQTPSTPTGDVAFSSSGSGSFSNPQPSGGANSCTLSPTGPNSAECRIDYTPSSVDTGIHTITAAYGGDAGHFGSSDTFDLQVNPRTTSTTVSCTFDFAPNYVDGGSTVTCTATVTDVDPQGTKSAPSGTVSFTSTGSGTFNPGSSCTLSAAGPDSSQCSVDYTPAAGSDGLHTITAAYQGSSVHDTSNGNTDLAVDDTAPTISHTVGAPQYPSGCTNHPDCFVTGGATLSISVTDPTVNGVTSGLASCTVTVTPPSGPAQNPTCTISGSSASSNFTLHGLFPGGADGVYTVTVDAQDNVGNTATTYAFAVYRDDTPPDNYAENLGTPNFTSGGVTYVKSTTPINVTGDDGSGSGIQGCTLAIDGGVPSSYTLGTDFTLPGPDGPHTYDVVCTDNLGNTSSPFSQTRTVDDTPPTIADPVHTNSTCYPTANCDAPPETVQGGTYVKALDQASPFVAASTFAYPSVADGTGSGVQSCTLSGTQSDGVYLGETVEGIGFRIAVGDGPKNFSVTCQDNLGNSSTNTSPLLNVDDTAPTINPVEHTNTTCYPTDRCDSIEPVQAGTFVKAQDQASPFIPKSTFRYLVSDPVVGGVASGLPGGQCTPGLSGTQQDGAYTPGDNFNIALGDGPKSFSIACRDNLGNQSDDTSPQLNVDDTAPTITGPFHTNTTCDPVGNCDVPPELVQTGVYVKALTQGSPFVPASTFKYDVADNPGGSGLPGGQCTPGLSGTQQNGTYTPGTDFNVAPGDGRKTFGIVCDDNLGNRATNTSPNVIVDDTPPTITPSIPGSPTWPVGCQGGPPNCYVNSLTTLRFTVVDPDAGTDPGSGFGGPNSGCTITVTGPGPNSPACTVLPGDNDYTLTNGGFATDGVYTNYAEATDNLGNYARSADLVVVLDNTPPQIGKDIPGAPTYLGGSPAGTECEGDPGTDCYVSSITTLRVTIVEPPAGTEPGSGFNHCAIQATGQNYGNVHSPGCGEGDNDFTLPGSLSDDRYIVAVPVARDNLGNTNSQNPLLEVILDNTAPTITTPIHTNSTCWPLDRCDATPEAVVNGTWVKARDKEPFTPTNPHLPPYPQVPRSTFQYPEAGSAVDPTPIRDPDIAPGLPGSGLLDCTLSGGTTADGIYTPGFGAIDFSFLPGDGARTFRLDCRDNLSYSIPVNTSFDQRTLNVDDTPPVASFVTAGPRYDDPTDGTIFVKTITVITPVLTDAGVGVDLNGYTGDPFDGPPGNPPCFQNIDRDVALTMPCLTPFTFPPPDRDHHFWIARPDKLGNVAESHFIFFVDDTPPAVRLITPEDHGQYLLREEVRVQWEATDNVSFFGPQDSPLLPPGVEPRGSGIREVIATAPNGHLLDTSSVGAKIFTLTAVDNLGHTTTVTVTYLVVYDFFIEPSLVEALAEGHSVGEEISLAFRLLDAQGEIVPDAEPILSLVDPETGEVVRDFRPHNRAIFDEETGFYTFVFSTEGLSAGEYEIRVQPGDTTTRKIRLVLSEQR